MRTTVVDVGKVLMSVAKACEGGRRVRCSHLPTRSRPPRPRRQHEDEVDPAGLEVRGQGEGPDPDDSLHLAMCSARGAAPELLGSTARNCWTETRRTDAPEESSPSKAPS